MVQDREIVVIDDFLPEEEFRSIRDSIFQDQFPWQFCQSVASENCSFFEVENEQVSLQNQNFYFNHALIMDGRYLGYNTEVISPLLEKLTGCYVIRAIANLYTNLGRRVVHGLHSDMPFRCVTAIYYLNTCNGKTLFETGEECDSKENRVVLFDSSVLHSSVTQTDTKRRVVINLNFFQPEIRDTKPRSPIVSVYDSKNFSN